MDVKKVVKKIPFIYVFIKKIYVFFLPKITELYIRINCKRKTHEKIKVGFIVQLAESCWDKQVDVFNEMRNRSDFDVKLLVVPKNRFSTVDQYEEYVDNYFLKNYPIYSVKVFENNTLINIKKMKFDYVFYPRPYDAYLPKGIRSTDLVKFTRCCYIPYGYSLSDSFNDCNIDNPFFDNIYMEFTESEYIKTLLYTKYKKSCDKGIRFFEYLGYPCLKKYIEMNPSLEIMTITWTPRWSYDVNHGGSNFIEYKDDFLNFCRKRTSDINVIFRPHPMMFDELVSKCFITLDEKEKYMEELIKNKVVIDMVSPIDEVLAKTNILITDFSSIIYQFFLTNRPIIYCKKTIEFNESGREFESLLYEANSWTDVETFCKQLMNGNDFLRKDREIFINRKVEDIQDSAKKIVDRIVQDYRGKN